MKRTWHAQTSYSGDIQGCATVDFCGIALKNRLTGTGNQLS